MTIYDYTVQDMQGHEVALEQYRGKALLITNTASKCGFTPQYKNLQKLQDKYKEDLVVIGVPCNQFGNQEPGTPEEIQNFCDINYKIEFPLTEKINVKGKQQHPLYTWLTQDINNGVKNSSVKWNFQKYLIDSNGKFIDYYMSTTNPLSSKITNHLK